mmetsp:Transcript_69238/g.203221  ORF Transcript_69238/g.203221 Transcript_69238/m.203221 type:complete len:207 (-) Transcript_69238:2-622(-)
MPLLQPAGSAMQSQAQPSSRDVPRFAMAWPLGHWQPSPSLPFFLLGDGDEEDERFFSFFFFFFFFFLASDSLLSELSLLLIAHSSFFLPPFLPPPISRSGEESMRRDTSRLVSVDLASGLAPAARASFSAVSLASTMRFSWSSEVVISQMSSSEPAATLASGALASGAAVASAIAACDPAPRCRTPYRTPSCRPQPGCAAAERRAA